MLRHDDIAATEALTLERVHAVLRQSIAPAVRPRGERFLRAASVPAAGTLWPVASLDRQRYLWTYEVRTEREFNVGAGGRAFFFRLPPGTTGRLRRVWTRDGNGSIADRIQVDTTDFAGVLVDVLFASATAPPFDVTNPVEATIDSATRLVRVRLTAASDATLVTKYLVVLQFVLGFTAT